MDARALQGQTRRLLHQARRHRGGGLASDAAESQRLVVQCGIAPVRRKLVSQAMAVLRIFSYLPNPRIWKATIAARLCGVEVEVRGASASELSQWLWDFDARPIADLPPDILAAAERT